MNPTKGVYTWELSKLEAEGVLRKRQGRVTGAPVIVTGARQQRWSVRDRAAGG